LTGSGAALLTRSFDMLARTTFPQQIIAATFAALTLTVSSPFIAGCDKSGDSTSGSTSAAGKVKHAAGDAAAKSADALKKAGDAAGAAAADAQQAAINTADAVKQSAANAADAVAIELKNGLAKYETKINWLKGQAAEIANTDLNQMITTVQSKMIDLKGRIETALTGDNDAIASLKADGNRLLGEVRDQYEAAVKKLDELMKTRAAASPPSTLPDK